MVYGWPLVSAANMAKRQSSSDISECSKCRDLLKEPKLLSCLYYVCSDCIKIEVVRGTGATCPVCDCVTEVATPSLDDLPALFHISDMIESCAPKKSAYKCTQCEERHPSMHCSSCGSICDDCVKSHSRMKKMFRAHKLSDLSEGRQITIQECRQRCKELKFFCESCAKVFCEKCPCYTDHEREMVSVEAMKHEDTMKSLEEPSLPL